MIYDRATGLQQGSQGVTGVTGDTMHYESRPNRQAPTRMAVKGSDRNQSQ